MKDNQNEPPPFADLTDENLAQAGYETVEECVGKLVKSRSKKMIEGLRALGLHFPNLYLTKLPPKVALLQETGKVKLTNNRFETIPDEICRLVNLEELLIDDNRISSLPVALGKLRKLKKLDLKKNKLKQLPDVIWALGKLESLSVAENELESISGEIGKLKGLESLDLMGNRLRELPDSLGKLKKLRSLELTNNQLKRIPESVQALKGLNSLIVAGNLLDSLPDLRGLKKLSELDISDTKLDPEEVAGLVGPEVQITNIPANFEADLPPMIRRLAWVMCEVWFLGNPDADPEEYPPFIKTMREKWKPRPDVES